MVYELMEIFGILYDIEIDIKSNNNLEELTSIYNAWIGGRIQKI